ncbi:MAG: HAD family hydrolase, partial [Actinomycetia bacterium]|nr:HAD family hydrolase [Actinomycetes bacterium]
MTGARLRDRIAHHASRLGPGLRPEPLARAVTNALDVHPRLVTFDVFDTLVQRRVVGEDNRLALVGHLLGADGQWTGSASAFARARRQAVGGAASLTLEQIYPAVEPAFADAQQAITTELTSEGLLVRAVPGAAQALRRVRDAGVPVAMVSDTDLSADQLTDLLDGVGLLAAGDRVFSSSTEQVSKLEGSLFARVAGSYEISPSDIVHLGDGRWNDVTMARQAGCRARWVDHAAPTRFERALAEGGVIGAAVAGAARRARLDLEAGEPELHRLERLGADVAGGAFSAFLLWLRQQVEAEGLGQVAFLARDGRLLHDMAHDMPSDHWEGFDLHYLRASRRAWLLAAASAVGVHDWIEVGCRTPDAFIHHSRHDIPFRSLLARIGLDPDDLDQHPEL